MADQTTESILFEIRINSEQYKQEQKLIRDSLGQLTLDIEKTKAAQAALKKERDAGKISDAKYAEQSVKLREQLKGQNADYRDLSKALETSQKVMVSGAGSIDQLRARLSELTVAYNALSAAERDNSDEGKRLQAEAKAVSDELKVQEARIGDNRRNVGNYGAAFKQGLSGIVAELAKIAAEQKNVDAASEQGRQLEQKRIGFLTAAQRAAAQAGISDFTQAKATIDQYTQALTPAAENLVNLQREQQQVGQSTGEASEQYQVLGFRIAGAQKSLDDLVSAQQAAEQAARNGGAAAQGQAGATEVAANSLAGLRLQLIALKAQRETLDPTTQEAQELNAEILELDTRIQQAAGKIDEFGEKVQRNIKKENFDTVTDAVQGMVGAFSVATLVLGDNSDAAAAQAKALQLMAIAQNARAIAIGLDSAKDAAQIVLLKAKSIFLKEEAVLTAAAAVSTEAHAAVASVDAAAIEGQAGAAALNAGAQAESAAATAGATVATEAQVVATESATVAQRALNLVLRLNPIGLLIIAVAALVAGFLAYRNASDATQKKVRDITEAFLRFSNPIGLVYTGIEKLYQKFAGVRAVLDPVIDAFNRVAGEVKADAIAFAQYIGLMDTAIERAAKLAEAELERATALRAQADAEIQLAQATGASAREVTEQKLAEIAKQLTAAEANEVAQQALHQKDLKRIAEKQAAQKLLSDSDKKVLEDLAKASALVTDLRTQQATAVAEGVERDRAARQQEAADIQTNAQRAVQNLARRIEQQDAAENAALQRNLSRIALRLSAVQKGTEEELRLQKQQVQAQAALEIKQAQDALAEKTRLRAVGYAREREGLRRELEQALNVQGQTEQQKTEITADYAQRRADLEAKYSLAAARLAVAQIPLVRAQANAASLKLEADYQRQVLSLLLQSSVEATRVQIAAAKEGSVQRRELELANINLEQEAAIAALDRRAMSDLEYETRVTAIRADAVAKRKALSEQDTQNVIAELGAQQQGAQLNQQRLLAGQTEYQQARTRASQQYYNEQIRAEIASYAAGVAATKAGTTERENVEKQHSLNLLGIEQERSQNQVALIVATYDKIAAGASQSISALSTFQDAASQDQLNRIQKEMDLSTTSQARKAVLAKQQERIEQQQHERQKKYAIAQAVIDGGSAVMRILADTPKFDFGIATAAQILLAGITTAAQIRAISSQKFAAGGVVQGPSHARGGVQMWHRNGAHLGEMEGDEIILTKGVFRNPKLRAQASALNVAGGGRPFYSDPTPPATWARYAQGGVVSSSAMYLPQVRTGGVVQQATAPAIDYDLLAAKLVPAFVAGAQALPAPETNLTELRQQLTSLDKRDAATNI
jgi:hypothetical protein